MTFIAFVTKDQTDFEAFLWKLVLHYYKGSVPKPLPRLSMRVVHHEVMPEGTRAWVEMYE